MNFYAHTHGPDKRNWEPLFTPFGETTDDPTEFCSGQNAARYRDWEKIKNVKQYQHSENSSKSRPLRKVGREPSIPSLKIPYMLQSAPRVWWAKRALGKKSQNSRREFMPVFRRNQKKPCGIMKIAFFFSCKECVCEPLCLRL